MALKKAGIDISGLASIGGQVSPRAVPRLEGSGTDEMHIARKRQVMPEGHNRPTLQGRDVDTLAQTDALLAGFTRMYELLRTERDRLVKREIEVRAQIGRDLHDGPVQQVAVALVEGLDDAPAGARPRGLRHLLHQGAREDHQLPLGSLQGTSVGRAHDPEPSTGARPGPVPS